MKALTLSLLQYNAIIAQLMGQLKQISPDHKSCSSIKEVDKYASPEMEARKDTGRWWDAFPVVPREIMQKGTTEIPLMPHPWIFLAHIYDNYGNKSCTWKVQRDLPADKSRKKDNVFAHEMCTLVISPNFHTPIPSVNILWSSESELLIAWTQIN